MYKKNDIHADDEEKKTLKAEVKKSLEIQKKMLEVHRQIRYDCVKCFVSVRIGDRKSHFTQCKARVPFRVFTPRPLLRSMFVIKKKDRKECLHAPEASRAVRKQSIVTRMKIQ